MTTFPKNFYPLIENDTWQGKEHCLNRPILEGTTEAGLLVAYSEMSEMANQTLTNEAFQSSGMSANSIEAIAVENWLAKFGSNSKWETIELSPEISIFTCRSESDAFSGGIVSEGIRKGIQQSLGSQEVCIAVPDRFTIIASKLADSYSLKGIVSGMYQDAINDGRGPLSPRLLICQKGQLTGYVTSDDEPELQEDPNKRPAEELAFLGEVPLSIFLLVAAADGHVDEKEQKEFAQSLQKLQSESSGLLQVAFAMCIANFETLYIELAAKSAEQRFFDLNNVRENLTQNFPQEAAGFFNGLYAMGERIAKASGGGLFRSKIGKEEKVALLAIKKIFGI